MCVWGGGGGWRVRENEGGLRTTLHMVRCIYIVTSASILTAEHNYAALN